MRPSEKMAMMRQAQKTPESIDEVQKWKDFATVWIKRALAAEAALARKEGCT